MFTLNRKQIINKNISEVWDFFSSPKNLSRITPSYLNFKIKNAVTPEKIHNGMMIKYTVSPLMNIPVTWVTEINKVMEPSIFIDKQIKGPYKFWEHKHTFVNNGNHTIMEDEIIYDLYGGPLKFIINNLLVKPKLRAIFDFRKELTDKIFNS